MIDAIPPTVQVGLMGYRFTEYLETCGVSRKAIRTRYAEARLPTDAQEYLITYPDMLNWVFVVEEDNPDSITLLPILVRMTEASSRLNLQILPAEQDYSLLDELLDDDDLTEDLEDIELPLLLVFDDEWNFLFQWGPRPEAADGYLVEWLENHPEYEELATDDSPQSQQDYLSLLSNLTQEMRVWYNSNLDQSCVHEIKLQLEMCQEQNPSDNDADGANNDGVNNDGVDDPADDADAKA